MTNFAVLTVSDTRTLATDASGDYLVAGLEQAGYQLSARLICPDDAAAISLAFAKLQASGAELILTTGGTGIALRDVTIETLSPVLVKTMPGFGEAFRAASFAAIGAHALATRAEAGVTAASQLVYLLPGSLNACTMALDAFILPELNHLMKEVTKDVHTR